MKTLAILLLSCSACFGQLGNVGFLASLKSVSACSTADSLLPHDTLLEGFQNGGFETANWTSPAGSPDPDFDTSALTSNKPVGNCNKGGDCSYTGSARYFQHDLGSNIDLDTAAVDVYFYVWVASATSQTSRTGSWGTSATPGSSFCGVLRLTSNGSGTTSFLMEGAVNSAAISITEGQWSLVKIHFDTTAASSYLQINGGTQEAFTRSAGNIDFRYSHIGGTHGITGGENATFVVDQYAINTP